MKRRERPGDHKNVPRQLHVQPDRMHQRTLHTRQRPSQRGHRNQRRRPQIHQDHYGSYLSNTGLRFFRLGRHSQKSSSIMLGYIEPGHAGAKAMRKLGL